MRLFAALDPPEEVIDAIALWWTEACVNLPAGEWRDIPKQNWHLTLAFYGDVDGDCYDDLAEALAQCAHEAAPITLRLEGFGVFPRPDRARVFWIGIGNGGDTGLRGLARCCRRQGFANVRKQTAKLEPFRGHITLARRRGLPGPITPACLAQMPEVTADQWQADCLRLYQSELHHDGARYRVLEEFELGG